MVNTTFFKIVEVVIKTSLPQDGVKIVFPINQNEYVGNTIFRLSNVSTFFNAFVEHLKALKLSS